jgi:hypothetical protein
MRRQDPSPALPPTCDTSPNARATRRAKIICIFTLRRFSRARLIYGASPETVSGNNKYSMRLLIVLTLISTSFLKAQSADSVKLDDKYKCSYCQGGFRITFKNNSSDFAIPKKSVDSLIDQFTHCYPRYTTSIILIRLAPQKQEVQKDKFIDLKRGQIVAEYLTKKLNKNIHDFVIRLMEPQDKADMVVGDKKPMVFVGLW